MYVILNILNYYGEYERRAFSDRDVEKIEKCKKDWSKQLNNTVHGKYKFYINSKLGLVCVPVSVEKEVISGWMEEGLLYKVIPFNSMLVLINDISRMCRTIKRVHLDMECDKIWYDLHGHRMFGTSNVFLTDYDFWLDDAKFFIDENMKWIKDNEDNLNIFLFTEVYKLLGSEVVDVNISNCSVAFTEIGASSVLNIFGHKCKRCLTENCKNCTALCERSDEINLRTTTSFKDIKKQNIECEVLSTIYKIADEKYKLS